MFLLYIEWASRFQDTVERLYFTPQLTFSTDPKEAYRFETEEEACLCTTWLAHHDRWKIEKCTEEHTEEHENSTEETEETEENPS